MKRYIPLFTVVLVLSIASYIVIQKKQSTNTQKLKETTVAIGPFKKERSCVQLPKFLKGLHIPQPVMIDLSQKQYKGIALLYGKQMQKALHPKLWERYAYFGTYALDREGNIFLTPMPFISIDPTTFNLQKNIYMLESQTGELSIFMHLDEVHPSASNPYGVTSVAYDCDDHTLWVSTLDETDYQIQQGVVYHIDIKTKKVLTTFVGVDALTLKVVKQDNTKYLLLGAARDNGLYAFKLTDKKAYAKPQKLLALPNPNEHIRKIKIKKEGTLAIQSIPFSYTLIAQTDQAYRTDYTAIWNSQLHQWKLQP